jgi:hypothetical protein
VNPQALMSAIPWVRRVWKVMPPALRAPLLLVGAAAGVWYALEGRRELQEIKEREAREG